MKHNTVDLQVRVHLKMRIDVISMFLFTDELGQRLCTLEIPHLQKGKN